MKMTFRWYGSESDKITLKQIKQIPGCTGLMGVLDYKAAGEVWEEDEIKKYIDEVHAAGLECEVIESVNVHEDIKLGLPTRDQYIENYCKSIRNLAKYGVKVIVYNFMPVLDWLRTDLARVIPEDGSNSLYYDEAELGTMTPMEIVRRTAENSNGFSLDGIIPTCEEVGVKMACHPDDPGWPIFGLPRITHDQAGFDRMVKLHDSPCNTLCLCTGSLGSNVHNDIPAMIRHFGEMDRIGCLHVRNIKHLGSDRRFRESSHLSSDGDLDMYEIMKAAYETCPDTYIRPDHGRMIWDEVGRPGYGLYDRALGIAYLNGLWEAIDKNAKRG